MLVEQYFFLLISFILGACVGSFLNVVVDRIPRDEPFLFSTSHCENCHTRLAWYDLIPLFSYSMLRGKCRYCGISLSGYYPLVEVLTGIFFLICGVIFFSSIVQGIMDVSIFYTVLIGCGLIVIFFTDIKYGIIPDQVIGTLLLITLISNTINHTLLLHLWAAVGAFLFFYALFFFTKGKGMGFGDVKLAFLIGFLLGPLQSIFALYVAFLTGAVVSLILVLGRKKKFHGGTIPFGPFMILGVIISVIGGELFSHFIYTFF